MNCIQIEIFNEIFESHLNINYNMVLINIQLFTSRYYQNTMKNIH